MEPEQVMTIDEDLRDDIHSSLDHLRFFANVARRTELYERCDEVGWSYGGGERHSHNPYGVFGEQAWQLARILEGDDMHVWFASVDDFTAYDHENRSEPVVIYPFEFELGDEDMAVVIEGDTTMVEKYADAYGEGLRGYHPTQMKTATEVLEEHPGLRKWIGDYYPDAASSRKAFYVESGMYDWGEIYNWFDSLIDAWRIVHGKTAVDAGQEEDRDDNRRG